MTLILRQLGESDEAAFFDGMKEWKPNELSWYTFAWATEMLRQALDYSRCLGLQSVMLSCSDANVPSWKIIERLGGVLHETSPDVKGELTRKYWISL